MASTLRDLRFLRPMRSSICSQCRRAFSNTPIPQAGHNKWSKIKHTKGRKDAKITSERTTHVQAIKLYSQRWCLPTPSSRCHTNELTHAQYSIRTGPESQLIPRPRNNSGQEIQHTQTCYRRGHRSRPRPLPVRHRARADEVRMHDGGQCVHSRR